MLDQQVDDKGTDQTEAKEIIRNLCDGAFEGDAGKLAIARSTATPTNWPSRWADQPSMCRLCWVVQRLLTTIWS